MSRPFAFLLVILSLTLACERGPNDDDDSSDDDDTSEPPLGCLLLETEVTNGLGEATASFPTGADVHFVTTLTNVCDKTEEFTTTSSCFWDSWTLAEQVGGEDVGVGCDDAITEWTLEAGQSTADEQVFNTLSPGVWVWEVHFGEDQSESWTFDVVLEIPG